jgi:hypothetical protein
VTPTATHSRRQASRGRVAFVGGRPRRSRTSSRCEPRGPAARGRRHHRHRTSWNQRRADAPGSPAPTSRSSTAATGEARRGADPAPRGPSCSSAPPRRSAATALVRAGSSTATPSLFSGFRRGGGWPAQGRHSRLSRSVPRLQRRVPPVPMYARPCLRSRRSRRTPCHGRRDAERPPVRLGCRPRARPRDRRGPRCAGGPSAPALGGLLAAGRSAQRRPVLLTERGHGRPSR